MEDLIVKESPSSQNEATPSKPKRPESPGGCFIKNCSIFDTKQSKDLINSIKEIANVFQNSTLNKNEDTPDRESKIKKLNLEEIEKLSVSDTQFCTTCQLALKSREDQVSPIQKHLAEYQAIFFFSKTVKPIS